jgi:Uma2 family endonuclease
MTPVAQQPDAPPVEYPDSDGNPMAENTLQYQWIVAIQGNLDLMFAGRRDVFVAGGHLIYPVEGNNRIRQAPDVYVAFGRPKGHRGSYRVWEEDGIFPQVIFEVLSPGNRFGEMARKFVFYESYGAEEYYILDPDLPRLQGYVRNEEKLEEIPVMNGWTSPMTGIRFQMREEVELFWPGGRRFHTFVELGELQLETARRADAEKQRADTEKQRADTEKQRAEKHAAKLRELGIDPDAT